MVPGKCQDIADAESRGPEEVALERQPVPVTAGQLKDRLYPFPDKQGRGCQGRNPHVGTLVVSDIDGIDNPAQRPCSCKEVAAVRPLGRADFGGYDEFACIEFLLEAGDHLSTFSFPGLRTREKSLAGAIMVSRSDLPCAE